MKRERKRERERARKRERGRERERETEREGKMTHFLSCALQVASLDVIFDILFAFSPSLSTLRTPRIALILFVALPSLLRYQVVPHVVF